MRQNRAQWHAPAIADVYTTTASSSLPGASASPSIANPAAAEGPQIDITTRSPNDHSRRARGVRRQLKAHERNPSGRNAAASAALVNTAPTLASVSWCAISAGDAERIDEHSSAPFRRRRAA